MCSRRVRDLASRPAVLDAARERGVELDVLRLDLADPASIEEAVTAVVAETGSVFGLVNNGGIGLRGAVEDSSEEEIERVFETNVLGTVAVTRAVLPHMREAGCGRIVTITSIGGRVPGFGVSIYCASKFAQEGLAEGLALELAPFGIQSIIVEPGIIKTPRWAEHRGTAEGARDESSPYFGPFWASEAIADRIVERSPTRPADVAAAVETALTDDAAPPALRRRPRSEDRDLPRAATCPSGSSSASTTAASCGGSSATWTRRCGLVPGRRHCGEPVPVHPLAVHRPPAPADGDRRGVARARPRGRLLQRRGRPRDHRERRASSSSPFERARPGAGVPQHARNRGGRADPPPCCATGSSRRSRTSSPTSVACSRAGGPT